MKFLHASVLFCFAGTSTASVQCTNDDLKTIAELQVSDVTSYPIAGDCISNLNSTMAWISGAICEACTNESLSTEACKLCYARSASYAVGFWAYPNSLQITNSTCTSMEFIGIYLENCWSTATSLSECPVSVSNVEYSVSETCASCAQKAFVDHADDCKTPCSKDMNDGANKAFCKSCSQAQYLVSATYCLTVSSDTTSTTTTSSTTTSSTTTSSTTTSSTTTSTTTSSTTTSSTTTSTTTSSTTTSSTTSSTTSTSAPITEASSADTSFGRPMSYILMVVMVVNGLQL